MKFMPLMTKGKYPLIKKIPFDVFDYKMPRDLCNRFHHQTPERLAQRGGLAPFEAYAILISGVRLFSDKEHKEDYCLCQLNDFIVDWKKMREKNHPKNCSCCNEGIDIHYDLHFYSREIGFCCASCAWKSVKTEDYHLGECQHTLDQFLGDIVNWTKNDDSSI